MKKFTTFDEFMEKELKNPEFKAAYDALVAQGKAVESENAISLTEKGLAELEDQLDAERVSIDEDSIGEVYEAFLPLDEEFAALIDDADADSLAELDRRAANLFDDLSAFVPRLSRYQIGRAHV